MRETVGQCLGGVEDPRRALLGEGLRPSRRGRPEVSAFLNRENSRRAGCGVGMRETFGRASAGSTLYRVLREDPRRACRASPAVKFYLFAGVLVRG